MKTRLGPRKWNAYFKWFMPLSEEICRAKKIYAMFVTVTERLFQKKIKSTEAHANDAMLRSRFFSGRQFLNVAISKCSIRKVFIANNNRKIRNKYIILRFLSSLWRNFKYCLCTRRKIFSDWYNTPQFIQSGWFCIKSLCCHWVFDCSCCQICCWCPSKAHWRTELQNWSFKARSVRRNENSIKKIRRINSYANILD